MRSGATGVRFSNASGFGNGSREKMPSTWFRASPPTTEGAVSSPSFAAMSNWAARSSPCSPAARQNLANKQVAQGMRGAEVRIVNRNYLMHVKSCDSRTRAVAVVSSGNFAAPGMAQNGERPVLRDCRTARGTGFSRDDCERAVAESATVSSGTAGLVVPRLAAALRRGGARHRSRRNGRGDADRHSRPTRFA